MDLTVKLDTRAASRMLGSLQKTQISFATMTALNDVAFTAQAAERAAFGSFFEHPRPFTAKAVQVTKARKSLLTSRVFIRREVSAYLEPYEFGGVHVVPGKMQLVPINVRLDQYGQLTKRTLANLNEQANDPKSGVFFGVIDGVRGYWMRVQPPEPPKTRRRGRAMFGPWKPPARIKLLAEVEAPKPVNEHLDFVQNASHQVVKAWPAAFERAMAKALASSRG